MNTYKVSKTIKSGLKYFVIFALPVLVDRFIISCPELAQLTIGGLLVMATNWLKHKADITLGGLL